jgi:uncharacterized protein HemX
MTWFTTDNILFAITVLAVGFSVYSYFRNPQIDTEKKDALLQQQVQWAFEATERRFKEMNENFQLLLAQSQNHIHTVDTKVENLTNIVTQMGKDIVCLRTIIEERIPRKTNS